MTLTEISLLASASGLIYVGIRKYLNSTRPKSEVSTSFKFESSENDPLNDLEEKIEAGESYKRISNKQLEKWQNSVAIYSVPKFTSNALNLYANFRRNARLVSYEWRKGDKAFLGKTYVYGVCGNFALFNTHNFALSKSLVIRVPTADDLTGNCRVTNVEYRKGGSQNCIELSDDVCLIQLDKPQFRDVVDHFSKEIFRGESSGCIDDCETRVKFKGREVVNGGEKEAYIVDNTYVYPYASHEPGKCGLPLSVDFNGRSMFIGIHTAGACVKGVETGFAAAVTQAQIRSGLEYFSKTNTFNVLSQSAIVFNPTPLPKSMVHHEDLRGLEYLGRDDSVKVEVNQKSKVEKTPIHKEIRSFMKEFGMETSKEFAPPLMSPCKVNGDYVNPMSIGIKKMASETGAPNHAILKITEDIIVDQLLKNLREKGVTTLKPWNLKTAVNGAKDDAFARRMNMNTSIGPGFRGKKSDFFPIVAEEDNEVVREPLEIIKEKVNAKVREIISGTSSGMRCKVALKDEPREKEKVLQGKTRLFYIADIANYTLARMLLGPFYSLMVENSDAFYCAVGTDMHTEASKIYNRMASFSENIMEGDYGGFDLKMPFAFKKCVANIIVRILRELGYCDFALKLVEGLLSDGLFPIIEVYGDIFRAAGLQPSGKYATAEDNCLVNLVMLVYAWVLVNLRQGTTHNFFEHNRPCTYGDDLLNAVSEFAKKFFNNIVYAKIVGDHYRMEFTPASKTGELSEFVSLENMSFLKRKFRFNNDYGYMTAPIDPESIARSLMWTIPSNEVLPVDQMIGTTSAALKELTFHVSRDKMYECRDKLLQTISKGYNVSYEYLDSKVLTLNDFYGPTSESYVSCVPMKHKRILELISESRSPSPIFELANLGGKEEEPNLVVSGFHQGEDEMHIVRRWCYLQTRGVLIVPYDLRARSWYADPIQKINDCIDTFNQDIKEADQKLSDMICPYPNHTWEDVIQTLEFASDPDYQKRCIEYHNLESYIEGLHISVERLKIALKRVARNTPQSEAMVSETVATTKEIENLIAIDPDESGYTDTFHKELDFAVSSNHDLDKFFSRPVQILGVPMTLASNVNISYDVANSYLSVPSVRAKLKNYGFLRATFHVRIMTTATPFHVGSLFTNVLLYPGMQDMAVQQMSRIGSATPDVRKSAVYFMSTTKGCRLMNFKTNKVVDITMPWQAPSPMGRLFNNSGSVLSNGTALDDFVGYLGVYAWSPVQPNAVSATASSPYLYIYVWMTDVKLAGLTGTQVSITSESEMKTGPIEAMSTAALAATTMLEDVPIIGPYAKASQYPLKVVNKVSAAMGLSEPNMIPDPQLVRNDPYQNTATTIGKDVSKPITFDPMCEISVDPRVAGSDEDEMSLSYICKIPGMLTQATWTPSNANFTPLLTIGVNPRSARLLSTRTFQLTPLAAAATPFTYWRGNIKYHLRIIASEYHRGKLGIWYEPNISQATLTAGALSLNKQCMAMLDLQESTELDVEIGWNHSRQYLAVNTNLLMTDSLTLSVPTNHSGYSNGVVFIAPIMTLQTPLTTVGVEILVGMSSDNVKFNVLNDFLIPNSVLNSESWHSGEVTTIKLGEDNLHLDKADSFLFGEFHGTSIAALSKRFVHTATTSTTAGPFGSANNPSQIFGYCPILPYLYPNTTGSNPFLAITPSAIGWFRNMFLGFKGGWRKRIRVINTSGASYTAGNITSVSLAYPATSHPGYSLGYFGGPVGCYNVGTALFAQTTNAGIEVRLPYYSQNYYGWAGWQGYEFRTVTGTTKSCMDPLAISDYGVAMEFNGIVPGKTTVSEDSATGDDFRLVHWMGAPGYSI